MDGIGTRELEKFSLSGGASLISVSDQETHQHLLSKGMLGASTW